MTTPQTPIQTQMSCTQIGDLPSHVQGVIHRLLRRADLHSLSLTSLGQKRDTQELKKEWSEWDEKCKKWEYIKDFNPQYPQFYLGIPPSYERQHNKDGAKLRLFIQQQGLSDNDIKDPESTIIAMDYNPMIIDDLDPRFPGIPIIFNFNKINERGDIQRVVIGDHRSFLRILHKCKDVLENLIEKTAIWTIEDMKDLLEEREFNNNLKPYPGYVEGEANIEQNVENLQVIYKNLSRIIQTKIDAYPKEPGLKTGGNKKIKKKKQTK